MHRLVLGSLFAVVIDLLIVVQESVAAHATYGSSVLFDLLIFAGTDGYSLSLGLFSGKQSSPIFPKGIIASPFSLSLFLSHSSSLPPAFLPAAVSTKLPSIQHLSDFHSLVKNLIPVPNARTKPHRNADSASFSPLLCLSYQKRKFIHIGATTCALRG